MQAAAHRASLPRRIQPKAPPAELPEDAVWQEGMGRKAMRWTPLEEAPREADEEDLWRFPHAMGLDGGDPAETVPEMRHPVMTKRFR